MLSPHHTTTKQDAPWLFPPSAGGGWIDECSAADSPSPPIDEEGASTAAALVASAPAAAVRGVREVPKDSGGLSQGTCRDAAAPPKTAARSAAKIEGLITNSPANDGMKCVIRRDASEVCNGMRFVCLAQPFLGDSWHLCFMHV